MDLYKRSYDITTTLIDGNEKNLRYLISVTLPGIYGILSENYRLGRNDTVVRGMRDSIYDFICEEVMGGCEATFATQETYEWWNNMSDHYFYSCGEKCDVNGHIKKEYQIEGPIFEDE